MRTLPITVAADADYPLPGLLTLPDGAGPFPAVLLVHGSGPQDRDEAVGPNRPFRDLAVGLADLGVASLRYDKRTFAHGKRLADALQGRLSVEEEVGKIPWTLYHFRKYKWVKDLTHTGMEQKEKS